MASNTVASNRFVRSLQQVVFVMIWEQCRIPSRIRGMALNTICRETEGLVVWVDTFIVIIRVTPSTSIGSSGIISIDVTRCTIIFYSKVCPCQDIILIVIERRRTPTLRSVAFLTGSWKLRNIVIGIFGRSIICSVASRTSGWRIGINITLMAIYTAMRGGFMGSIQYKIFIVIRKCSRTPPRCGGMTLRTIRREAKGLVIWVDTTVVIFSMTARAGSRSITEVTSLVAFFTIIGDDLVSTR
jgi:hypothetical protein